MSPIGKVFVVLNLVFSLVVLGVLGGILSKSEEWKAKHDEVSAQYQKDKDKWAQEKSELETRIRDKERENAALDTAKRDLEVQFNAARGERDQALNDLRQAQNNVRELQADVRSFVSTQEQLQSANQALVAENQRLIEERNAAADAQRAAEEDAARARSEIARQNDRIAQLQSQIDALAAERGDLSAQIEAAIQAGFDISKVRAFPEIHAVVENVNHDLGIVVLSVGRDDGVTKGMKFHVYGGEYKGEVIVDDIYPDNCAARIVPNSSGRMIAVMDKATTRL